LVHVRGGRSATGVQALFPFCFAGLRKWDRRDYNGTVIELSFSLTPKAHKALLGKSVKGSFPKTVTISC
jgi:hypothetical protein